MNSNVKIFGFVLSCFAVITLSPSADTAVGAGETGEQQPILSPASDGADGREAASPNGSPDVDEYDVLTLDEAIKLAKRNNPTLVAKRLELGIADGELRQASIYFQNNPELSVRVAKRRIPATREAEAGLTANKDGGLPIPLTFGSNTALMASPVELPPPFFSLDGGLTRNDSVNTDDLGIELSQEFEIFGQPKARRMASAAARESVLGDIASTEWEVMALVRAVFYASQIAELRTALADEQYDFAESVLRLSQQQLDAGDVSGLDFRQVEIQTASLRTSANIARAERESALESLRLILGMPSSAGPKLPSVMATAAPISQPPDEALESILTNFPLLQHARLVTEQRERERKLVRKVSKPNITAIVFYDREGDEGSSFSRSVTTFGGLSLGRRSPRDSHQEIFGAGLSIPIPVFNRGQGNIAAAQAAVDVASAQSNAINSEVRSRAKTAIQRLASSYDSAVIYSNEILPDIHVNLDLLENAYRQGELSLLDLRVNQRDLIDAQSAGLDALGEYYRWRAEVEGLLGRSLVTDDAPL